MTITKEKIDERLKVLKNNLQQLEAHVQALNGAVQDCEYWLTVIDEPEAETQEPDANSTN